ncbi:MAG: serine hydrolase domain-containing protein, partial [Planctomycetaceae bacterium]|nr:serine hydrolase domain-containing protein [Planctomycetaceae bacterium]
MFEQTIHRRTFLAACGTLACPTLMTGAQEPTVSNTGETSKEWQPLDELLTNFVREQQSPGAAVAVAHQSKIVYARGFGWADKDRQRPVQPDSLFRIASISKPVTAVAVLQLVEQGRVKLEDRFLDVVPVQPFVATGESIDARMKSITIRQLLQHTAGWDREKSFDPIGRPWEISAALGVEGAPSPSDVMRYGLGLKLDFDPGARYAYANVDYLCLGRLIEHCTGLPYVDAVRQRVLQPLGITRMNLGRAQESELAADEVRYYDRRNRRGKCLYPPHIGEEVPSVYGAENLQGYEAHGGWIASAVDLARFSAAFADPQRCPLLKPETIATMWSR